MWLLHAAAQAVRWTKTRTDGWSVKFSTVKIPKWKANCRFPLARLARCQRAAFVKKGEADRHCPCRSWHLAGHRRMRLDLIRQLQLRTARSETNRGRECPFAAEQVRNRKSPALIPYYHSDNHCRHVNHERPNSIKSTRDGCAAPLNNNTIMSPKDIGSPGKIKNRRL